MVGNHRSTGSGLLWLRKQLDGNEGGLMRSPRVQSVLTPLAVACELALCSTAAVRLVASRFWQMYLWNGSARYTWYGRMTSEEDGSISEKQFSK
eukprot:6492606-Amphidinium_carterae.2